MVRLLRKTGWWLFEKLRERPYVSRSVSGSTPARTEGKISNCRLPATFTAALVTTAERRKRPKCPPTEKWTNSVMRRRNGIAFSHEKAGNPGTCCHTGKPEDAALREPGQSQEDVFCATPCAAPNADQRAATDRMAVIRSWGGGRCSHHVAM